MSKKVNYNENLVAGAAIRDDKGRRISKLFEASHPKMTVGYAKNLIMPDDPTEQEFNFRQSGGGVIEDGVAVIDKVKGNSVVWNQQCKVASGSFSTSNLSVVASEDGVLVNGTASQTTVLSLVTSYPTARVVGHKYLLKGCPSGGSNGTYSFRYNANGFGENGTGVIVTCVAAGTSVTRDQMLETYAPAISIINGVECNNLLFRPRLIDLTQMFGAGNEPTTYEEFLQRKPVVEDEFAYNEGTIVNNKVEKVVTTGVNLWDEEWEVGRYDIISGKPASLPNSIRSKKLFRVPSGGKIIASAQSGKFSFWVLFFNGNKEYLKIYRDCRNIQDVPVNAEYALFYVSPLDDSTQSYGDKYKNDICINLSDASFNGQYAPYEEHTLDLSWIKDIKDGGGIALFEDGMKSAGTAFDEAAKGRAIKRIGVLDMGTLNWIKSLSIFYAIVENIATLSDPKDVLCTKYASMGDTTWDDGRIDKSISHTPDSNLISIRDDAYADAASFKAAMAGVMLYYELAEPIEVEYDEKNLTYPVVAGGTEEAIASEPSTAFRADIGYGIDAVKTILDLKARVEALEGK